MVSYDYNNSIIYVLYLGASYHTEEDITDLVKNTLASQFQ